MAMQGLGDVATQVFQAMAPGVEQVVAEIYVINDEGQKVFAGSIPGTLGQFSTGSLGFNLNGKAQAGLAKFQVAGNVVLVKSKDAMEAVTAPATKTKK